MEGQQAGGSKNILMWTNPPEMPQKRGRQENSIFETLRKEGQKLPMGRPNTVCRGVCGPHGA